MISFYLNLLESQADKELFEKLYKDKVTQLFQVARKFVANNEDAEDAVHNGFLHLAECFERYHYQSYENLVQLIFASVRNCASDIARDYHKSAHFGDAGGWKEEDVVVVMPSVLDSIIGKYEQELITDALMELDADERSILYLQYDLRLKPKEIGKLLKISAGAVSKKTYKSRKKLVKILEDEKYRDLR